MRPVSEIVKSIRESLRRADGVLWEAASGRSRPLDSEDRELIRYYLDRAFLQTLLFLELQKLPRMLSYLEGLYRRARRNPSAVAVNLDGEPYLMWDSELEQYLSAIEGALGGPRSTAVSQELLDMLKNCQYAITDPCFSKPPQNEPQVHERIEAVLRCVFPDLIRKPAIAKPIKNFVPDTGLPSVRTLIEYKFISNAEEAKQVADQLLADTRAMSQRNGRLSFMSFMRPGA
jgi:hypothetical protein